MVISGLHGTKPSELCTSASFLIFALRAFSILVILDMIRTHMDQGKRVAVIHADMVGSLQNQSNL
jgi:hypothetical protein